MTTEEHRRTLPQNKALHLYCTMLSDALNDAGYDMKKTLKPEIEIPWTPQMIKKHLWKPIQDAMLEKKSTTELETNEVDKVYQVLSRHLSERFCISVPFPDRFRGE
jgi:hypothetical protein